MFVGQEKGHDDNKEKMSIRSEGLESVNEVSRPGMATAGSTASKVRKVSAVSGLHWPLGCSYSLYPSRECGESVTDSTRAAALSFGPLFTVECVLSLVVY